MLQKGYCKKLTFNHLLNIYIKEKKLVTTAPSPRRKMEDIRQSCIEGNIPAGKLQIKVPTDSPTHPVKVLMVTIGSVMRNRGANHYSANFRDAVAHGKCTVQDVLATLPYLTEESKKALLVISTPSPQRKMDKVLKECLEGTIPAGKLYIKLPVESKSKEVIMSKIKHLPMKMLIERIGTPSQTKGDDYYTVNYHEAIVNKVCTKFDYLDALPFITAACKRDLEPFFDPPPDRAKLKVTMDHALKVRLVDRALNTAELAQMAMPDFDSSCYPVFYTNFLITPNLDTNSDLKQLHEHTVQDQALKEITALKTDSVILQMDKELGYIKQIWDSLNRRK